MQQPKSKPDFFVDFTVGMSDGLVIPFALATGLSVLFPSQTIVFVTLLFTIMSAVAMGLSRYVSGKAPAGNHQVEEIITALGADASAQTVMLEEATKTNEEWRTLSEEVTNPSHAVASAFTTGLSYFVAGFIPLIPFLLTETSEAIKISAVISVVALFCFGYIKGKLTAQHALSVALKTTIMGGFAAAAAYFVARLFG